MLATCDAYVFLGVVGWLWLVGIRESVYVPSKWVSHSSSRKKLPENSHPIYAIFGKRIQKPTKKPTKKHQKPTKKKSEMSFGFQPRLAMGCKGAGRITFGGNIPSLRALGSKGSPRLPPQNVT